MAQEYLLRNNSTPGNRKTWTWAGWVKISGDVHSVLYSSDGSNDGDRLVLGYYNNYFYVWGTSINFIQSTRLVRDSGNWHHVLVHLDTTQGQSGQRLNLYIDGVIVEAFNTDNRSSFTQNSIRGINRAAIHAIGRDYGAGSYHAEANLTDIFLVDGLALTPDVFGFYKDGKGYMSSGSQTSHDFRPGQWSPHSPTKIKKDIERRGGFGVNGFYLPMNDSSNPGADFHCAPNSIIKLKGEDLPQPRNGAPTTSDSYVSEVRKEIGELGFAGCVKLFRTGGYLDLGTGHSELVPGTGDFTIECFLYVQEFANYPVIVDSRSSSNDTLGFFFGLNSSGQLYLYSHSAERNKVVIQKGQWYHVALVRESNVFKLYVDGRKVGTDYTQSQNYSNQIRYIGESSNSESQNWNQDSFISNFRFTQAAVYTSNFTKPTEPLNSVTNTRLLCCQSSTSATATTVAPGSITASGGAHATTSELTGTIVVAIPGISGGKNNGYGDYSGDISGSGSSKTTVNDGSVAIHIFPGHYGSGMRFSGSGNSTADGGIVKIDSVSDLNMDLDDFTLEGWIFAHSFTQDSGVFGMGNGGAEPFLSWTNGVLRFRSDAGVLITSQITIAADMWHHVVLESHNQLLRLIINGVVAGEPHNNTHTFSQGVFLIGSWTTGKQYGFDGDIQDVRLYKGVAKYKGGFDVARPYTPKGVEEFRTVSDTCKNNFATFNPLIGAGTASGDTIPALKDGNLFLDNANQTQTQSSIGMSSGKWYCEYRLTSSSVAAGGYYGVVGDEFSGKNNQNVYTSAGFGHIRPGTGSNSYTKNWTATSLTTENPALGFVSGDIFGFALDLDSSPKNIKYYRNGALIHTDSTIGDSGHYYFLAMRTNDGASGANWPDVHANFGQNPSFSSKHAVNRNRVNTSNSNSIWHQSSNTGTHTDWTVSADGTNLQVSVASGAYARAYLLESDGTIDSKKKYIVSFDYVSGPANLGVQGGSPLLYLTSTAGDAAPNGLSAGNSYAFIFQGAQFAFTGFTGQTYHLNNVVVSEVGEGYTDSNGIGKFAFQPPSGYLALCEDNLPAPAIADPGKHFKNVMYTGNGDDANPISGVGFKPDLVWLKGRDGNSLNHILNDVIRGPRRTLFTNNQLAEYTDRGLNSFDEDGFTLASVSSNGGDENYNTSAYVAWCWKAGGTPVSNNDGSITTQVSANRTSGFSVVTGTMTSGTDTLGHGLGKAPKMIITKQTNGTTGWYTYMKDIGYDRSLRVDQDAASASFAHWVSHPDDSIFKMGSGFGSGEVYVAYCFAEIDGFSKIGLYTGNGNTSANGPFVYCGFKPAWIMMKNADTAGAWVIMDSARCSTNPNNNHLLANSANGQSVSNMRVDFVSNGFKIRNVSTDYTDINGNGNNIVFMAFAESPFQTANAK